MRLRLFGFLAALGLALFGAASAKAQECCSGPFAHTEFNILRTRHAPNAYAAGIAANGAQVSADTLFDYEPGYAAGIGYLLSDCWDVDFTYTRLENNGWSLIGNQAVDGNNVVVNRGLQAAGAGDFAAEALSLKYQLFDLTAGHFFRPVEGLTLRVTGGIRAAQVNFASDAFYANIGGGAFTSSQRDQIHMDGLGPRLGAEGFWNVGDTGFSLLGKAAVSIIYSDFNVQQNQLDSILGVVNRSFQYEQLIPVLEMRLGSRYDFGPCYVSSGYQFANWFGYYSPLNSNANGNLTFDGLFIEAGAIW